MNQCLATLARRRGFGFLGVLVLGAFALIGGHTAAAAPPATEKLLFNWTKAITTKDRGFPRFFSPHPSTNILLTKTPLNFAEGTLYVRVVVKDQPRSQAIKWQYCAWAPPNSFPEVCTRRQTIMTSGPGPRTVSWNEPITGMWRKQGVPLDWSKPRKNHGFAIMLPSGKNVTDYPTFKDKWGLQDPNAWFPINATGGSLKVVVVAKGYTFSGWQNYP